MSRPLEDNFHGTCPTGTAHAEIIRVYDSATGCPGTCSALSGKLAKVTASLLCSSTYSGTDGSLDQATWMSYDPGDRSIAEYTSDDSGRTANQAFVWTKNGALEKANTPSGAAILYSFGPAGSNSDTDRVTKVSRTETATPVIEDVTWFPYGPLAGYRWEATQGGNALTTSISRNVAYRPTYVGNGVYSGSSVLFGVTLDEDAKGRVIDWSGEAGCNLCYGSCELISGIEFANCEFLHQVNLGTPGHTGGRDTTACNEPDRDFRKTCRENCQTQLGCP